MPRYEAYWSTELRYSSVAYVLTRNRFYDMNEYFHLNDNSETVHNRDDPNYDRFYKVRPIQST